MQLFFSNPEEMAVRLNKKGSLRKASPVYMLDQQAEKLIMRRYVP